jgi:hypothetical protein
MQVTKYWLFQEKHQKIIIEHENISCLSVDLAVEADVAVENFICPSWKTVDAIVHSEFSQQTLADLTN